MGLNERTLSKSHVRFSGRPVDVHGPRVWNNAVQSWLCGGRALNRCCLCVGLPRISRKAQARWLAAGLAIDIDFEAARAELGPGNLFDWTRQSPVTNVGIVDDDVYMHACQAKIGHPLPVA